MASVALHRSKGSAKKKEIIDFLLTRNSADKEAHDANQLFRQRLEERKTDWNKHQMEMEHKRLFLQQQQLDFQREQASFEQQQRKEEFAFQLRRLEFEMKRHADEMEERRMLLHAKLAKVMPEFFQKENGSM